jgi:hypothetical protein
MLCTSAQYYLLKPAGSRQGGGVLPKIIRREHLPTLGLTDLLVREADHLPFFNVFDGIYKEGWEQRIFTDYAAFYAVVIRNAAMVN